MSDLAAEAGPSRLKSLGKMRQDDGVEDMEDMELAMESMSESDGSEGEDEVGEETPKPNLRNLSPMRADVKGKGRSSIPGLSTSPSNKTEKSSSWTDMDLSIIVALVSPIGNWLTGGDHIKNVFLIILLIFYLHQIIEIPWQLYLGARPRKSGRQASMSRTDEDEEQDEKVAYLTSVAQRELRRSELFYLALSIASPLVGAYFLRRVLASIGDHNSLSWFSITLFVLATGIRPWSHLITRLRERTHELHTALHYPEEDSVADLYEKSQRQLHAALKRVDALEHELKRIHGSVKRLEQLREVCDDLTDMLGNAERSAKRYERKADAVRAAQSVRLTALEQGVIHLEERRKRDVAAFEAAAGIRVTPRGNPLQQATSHVVAFVDRILYFPRMVILLGLEDPWSRKKQNGYANGNGNGVGQTVVNGHDVILEPHTRSPEREKHFAHLAPRLATIPEATDSDSDGTFVSDKDTPPMAGVSSPSRSRTKSVGSNASERVVSGQSVGQKAFRLAQNIFLWPYRFSARILITMIPPLRRFAPHL